jgi:hypothetical protein
MVDYDTYRDPLRDLSEEQLYAYAMRMKHLGFRSGALDQLDADELSRYGFNPSKLHVAPGVQDKYGVYGLAIPPKKELDGINMHDYVNGSYKGLDSNIAENEHLVGGDTILLTKPGESLDNYGGTMRHEADHQAMYNTGLKDNSPTGYDDEEALVRYIDQRVHGDNQPGDATAWYAARYPDIRARKAKMEEAARAYARFDDERKAREAQNYQRNEQAQQTLQTPVERMQFLMGSDDPQPRRQMAKVYNQYYPPLQSPGRAPVEEVAQAAYKPPHDIYPTDDKELYRPTGDRAVPNGPKYANAGAIPSGYAGGGWENTFKESDPAPRVASRGYEEANKTWAADPTMRGRAEGGKTFYSYKSPLGSTV